MRRVPRLARLPHAVPIAQVGDAATQRGEHTARGARLGRRRGLALDVHRKPAAQKNDRRCEFEDYNGIGFKSPVLSFSLSLFMLSLLGLPLTAGFMGKVLVFRPALEAGNPLVTSLVAEPDPLRNASEPGGSTYDRRAWRSLLRHFCRPRDRKICPVTVKCRRQNRQIKYTRSSDGYCRRNLRFIGRRMAAPNI